MEDDDLGLESVPFAFDSYLTVRGLLRTHYGMEHGDEIYELLEGTSRSAAEEAKEGSVPGIMFDSERGEFVGLEMGDS